MAWSHGSKVNFLSVFAIRQYASYAGKCYRLSLDANGGDAHFPSDFTNEFGASVDQVQYIYYELVIMTSITKTSLATGLVLVLLGAGSYFGTGRASVTALIPAFLGLPILICGLMARDEKKRMMAAHVAILFGVLGVLAGFGRGIPQLLNGKTGTATTVTLVMGAICLLYVIACVRSFIAARRG